MLYNKYIARQLIYSTALITVSLTSIVWLMQALRFVDFIVNQGVSILVFLKLTALLVPALLLIILPPAFFCAVIFTYNKMRSDSELVVMQAMGLSNWFLVKPALRVSIMLMMVAYFIALYIQPLSFRSFKELQNFLRTNYVSILLQEGVFSSPVEGLTVFIRERHDDGLLKGIIVHDSRKEGSAVTMMADEGVLVQTPLGPRFLLKNGNRQEEQDGRLSYLSYESYTLDVNLYSGEADARSLDPREMFTPELLRDDPALSEREIGKRRAEFHQRIIWPAYIPCLTLVALSLQLSGQFNRRGGAKRLVLIVGVGMMVLFSAVGFRGVVAKHDELTFMLYLLWLLPLIAAVVLLKKDDEPQKAALV